MLRHQNVGTDPRLTPRAHLFQHGLEPLPGPCRFKQPKTVKATECDEMQCFRLLELFRALDMNTS
jgi:hypothetical protein